MGQTHVNKLFKLLLNSQRVPFKISMGCQIWCLITQGSRKVERRELCESLGDRMMTGHMVTYIIHGALMVPLMVFVTMSLLLPLTCLSFPPIRPEVSWRQGLTGFLLLCLCPWIPGRLPSASSLAHSKCVQEDWSAGLPFWRVCRWILWRLSWSPGDEWCYNLRLSFRGMSLFS